jgi:hypothetical protein
MKVSQTGVYDIEFSAQLSNGDNSVDILDIWLSKNGTNIESSNTTLTIDKSKDLVAAWNWVDTATAGDYYEIMWSNTTGNVTIKAAPTSSSPTRPAIPSIIATIHRVDVGGITYVNSSTGQLIVSSSQTNALTVSGSASFTELTGSLSSFSSSLGSRINAISSSVSTSLAFPEFSTLKVSGSLSVTGSISIQSGSITMPNRPAFRVIGTGGPTAARTVLSGSMTNVDYNQGGWDNTTGTFTAPIAGLYQVNLVARCVGNSSPDAQIIVYKNNTTLSPGPDGTAQIMVEWAANTTANHMGGSTISKLAVGDTLKTIVTVGTISFDGNDNFSVAYIG